MKTFHAYLPLTARVQGATHPEATPLRLTTGLKKTPQRLPAGGQARRGKAQPAPFWQRWGISLLHAAVAELCHAADISYRLLHPFATWREELEAAWAAEMLEDSLSVLVAALLEDHAHCQALLTASPTQLLSPVEQAKLLARHARMTWLLRTYLD